MLQKIRNEPAPKPDKLETLINFSLAVQNLCGIMEATGLMTHIWNPTLLQELVEKLPAQIRLNWAMHLQAVPAPNLSTFSQWLSELAQAASSVTVISPFSLPTNESKAEHRSFKNKGTINAHSVSESHTKGSSKIKQSESDMESLNRRQRWNLVISNNLCRRCLTKHGPMQCEAKTVCGKNGCQQKHHPLLHNDSKDVHDNDSKKVADTTQPCNAHQTSSAAALLFRIVPVTLHGKNKSIDTFAFLDEGSSLTMLEEDAAMELELEGTPEDLCLKWTANTVRLERGSKRVTLDIAGSSIGSQRYTLKNVRTVKTLALPAQSMSSEEMMAKYSHLRDIPLPDYQNATPRILIGMDNCKLGLPYQVKEGRWREPVATRTRLGWTLQGYYHHQYMPNATPEASDPVLHHSFHLCDCSKDELLHALVKDFFSVENFGVRKSESSMESAIGTRELKLLQSTTLFVDDRFETGLLWKYDDIALPNSLPMAKRRWTCLAKKMSADKALSENLIGQMMSYVEKGYARKLSVEESLVKTARTWYLPVFAVKNHNKPGKIRMVWDAAAKVNGISLNSVLLSGPDLLTSLPFVLYGFRKGKIAICADIREMFHQIRVRKADQDSQRFLWGKNAQEPDEYVMQVMTFGATCSPSSAQFVKNLNAMRFIEKYPRAVEAITDHHYVDDLLDSVETVAEAISLAKAVIEIHQKGGFEIRNWISNSAHVLESLKVIPSETKKCFSSGAELHAAKVLGMWWCTQLDAFTYSTNYGNLPTDILFGKRRPTKREVLRTLMSVYDPLGFLAAFLVFMKILLQDIWRSKIEWDDVIPDKEFSRWLLWINLLPEVERVRIPRCYSFKISSGISKTTQLHVFVDASENAFAAVAYFRFATDDQVECALIGAKTKVAPQQPMSIPRLELQAAVLGTRLANSIIEGHAMPIQNKFMWSDSKTVLCWLNSDPRKYRQFVAFRVAEILEHSDVKDWRWIPTKLNVADDATKWNGSPEFDPTSRWFAGPEFLRKDHTHWPKDMCNATPSEGSEEVRCVSKHEAKSAPITVDMLVFSEWRKLLRSQAYLERCYNVIRARARRSAKPIGQLTVTEYETARTQLLARAQFDYFAKDIIALQNSKDVEKVSPLYKLSPYLDEAGILRVRGRIDAAKIVGQESKRPIILPRSHHLTELIVFSFHDKFHHINHESVLNEVQQKYYIARLRQLYKTIRTKCQRCKNAHAMPIPPEMAALPAERLAAFTRPFTYTGIDYFGPISVSIGRRVEKRWGVIFTCLTIRAVHLEIAHSLNADSFIMSLRNFIARRGTPQVIMSDNGTNFHGADRELRQATEAMQDHCAPNGIIWKFNPPASPHMGGSWERLVGSVKRVLMQIMPQRNPSDELLRAMLMEAESIVNTRPLTFVSLEASEDEALTPNHFLLGSSSGEKPPGEFCEKDLNLRKIWRKSQHLADLFWQKWVKSYLPTLTRRTKWFAKTKPIEIGDIALIADGNLPRNTWPKGKILATQPGKDGAVRKVTIQTKDGIYERPAVKIAVLDVRRSE